jgi:hypothetical protein
MWERTLCAMNPRKRDAFSTAHVDATCISLWTSVAHAFVDKDLSRDAGLLTS